MALASSRSGSGTLASAQLLRQRMPAVERQLGVRLVLGKGLPHHPVDLAGRSFGGGIEEEPGSVGGHRDAVSEQPCAVLRPALADGLGHAAGASSMAERNGHSPVIRHSADCTGPGVRGLGCRFGTVTARTT